MVTILKAGSGKKKIQSILKSIGDKPSKKGIDAKKYSGSVIFEKDGLSLQKEWRNEWK